MADNVTARPAARRFRLLAGAALGLSAAGTAFAQDRGAIDEDRVVVTGQEYESSSVSKLTQPLIETPQSVSVIPQIELESRAVSNLNDALRSVPGLTLGAGEFSWQGNTPTIRGFVARNDFYLDGMRDFGSYYRDPFNTQQLEVLQGPSSVYFGRGSTGGVINQTSKQPVGEAQTLVNVAAGTADTYRATADLNRPFDNGAFRLNAMAHTNQMAGRESTEYSRYGIAPSLALSFGPATRLTLNVFHQSEDNRPDYGLPWVFGSPAPVDPSTYYGFTDDYLETSASIATARLEHDLSPAVTLRNQARYADYSRDFRITEAVLTPGTTPAQPLATMTINRNLWSGDSTETFFQNQLDILARLDTGGLSHTLVAGVEVGHETSDPVFRNSIGVPPDSLLNPGPAGPLPPVTTYDRVTADTSADTLALFAVDTVEFSPQWEATLGVRWDRFDADYASVTRDATNTITSTAAIPQTDEMASWRAALVYKPNARTNLYAAAGTSFNPSAESLTQITSGRALTTNNANLDPEENTTYEVGAKIELTDALVASGAVFQLEKTNARVPDPANPGFNMLGGEQRVRGAQFQLTGYVTPAWYVSAGYTYLDSEVTATAPGGPPLGVALINAPEHSASLLTEYHFGEAFTAGAAVTYLDERLANNGATPLVAPDFVTVDLMVRYELTQNISVQLNVFNVFDEVYFDQLHPWHVVPGAGRSALVTLGFRY